MRARSAHLASATRASRATFIDGECESGGAVHAAASTVAAIGSGILRRYRIEQYVTHQYTYFPRGAGPIGSVMLDANVTARLDSIARRGSAFHDEATRERMSGLLDRLGDAEVLSMAGLGAAEGDIRRGVRGIDYSNFHRRSAHALSLLNENRETLRRWAAGEEVAPITVDLESERQKKLESLFGSAIENFLLPSYALILQAYWSYLNDSVPMRALRSVERVAVDTRCRGSREMMLAILLIAGTSSGRELALNIMKLRNEAGLSQTFDAAWNTTFDLTYTRMAVSTPLCGSLPAPVVFVTEDRHLSTFVNMIEPLGGGPVSNGAVLPLDSSTMEGLVCDELYGSIQKLMLASARATAANPMPAEQVSIIRRANSLKHIERLEELFSRRYSSEAQVVQ
jgi:hypothetical protein